MSTEREYKYLETRHGSLYRQPFIKGTRIRAEIPYGDTVPKFDEEDGWSEARTAEEVAADYRLPLEAVLQAIDWCQKHWDVVIADHAREDRLMEAHGMNHPDYKYNPKKYYRRITSEERARIINDEDLLDDDSADALLVRLLVRAGHDVVIPAQVGKAGEKDPIHFMYAIENGRVLLTRNHDDFELLHELVLLVGGHHPGLLAVRRDNNPKRDMDPPRIVRAIRNLLAASVPVADELIVLNHWR